MFVPSARLRWALAAVMLLGLSTAMRLVLPVETPTRVTIDNPEAQVPFPGAIQWPDGPYYTLLVALVSSPENPLGLSPLERTEAADTVRQLDEALREMLHACRLIEVALTAEQRLIYRRVVLDWRTRETLSLRPLDENARPVVEALKRAAAGAIPRPVPPRSSAGAPPPEHELEPYPEQMVELLRRIQVDPSLRLRGQAAADMAARVERLVNTWSRCEGELFHLNRLTQTFERNLVKERHMLVAPRQSDFGFDVLAHRVHRTRMELSPGP